MDEIQKLEQEIKRADARHWSLLISTAQKDIQRYREDYVSKFGESRNSSCWSAKTFTRYPENKRSSVAVKNK